MRLLLISLLICTGISGVRPEAKALPVDDRQELIRMEEILHEVLTYDERASERGELCARFEMFRDSETNLVLSTRCKVKGESFSLLYQAKGLVLSVVLPDGSVISDRGENGDIDIFPAGNKADWQKRFKEAIASVFQKNPSLSKLGFSFIYAISREYGPRW